MITNYYYFYLMAVFSGWTRVKFSLGSSFSTCFEENVYGLVELGFYGWMSFLSLNHQCQSTERNTKH